MSHEITERQDGTAEAVFALKPAWHGLGTVTDHVLTSEEALKLAQLDWDVEQLPLYAERTENLVDEDGNITQEKVRVNVPGFANFRTDTHACLGTVSDKYQLVQNREAFDFIDSLLQDEVIKYESAFSLSGGKKVVLLARFPETDFIADGDELKRYILFSTSHDGSEAIRVGPTSVRVVCANTYGLAKSKGGIESLSIRHTGDINEKLADVRGLLGLADGSFRRHTEICRRLVAKTLTSADWHNYLNEVVPPLSDTDPAWTKRRAETNRAIREDLTDLYCRGERQHVNGVGFTAYAAWNAVTEYVDHLPRRGGDERGRLEARFNVTQYGTGHVLKAKALDEACALAGFAPKEIKV